MNLNNATELLGVLSFGAAACACLFAWRRVGRIWGVLAAVHLFSMVEVTVGSRHHLAEVLRSAAQARALYEVRTGPLAAIILGILVSTLGLACWLSARRVETAPALFAVLCSFGVLFLFLLEAVSLHVVDTILYHPLGPVFTIAWLWTGLTMLVIVLAGIAPGKRN